MATRMNPLEKLKHYEGQLLAFENRKKWVLGRYTFSEYLFLFVIGLWAAFVIPKIVPEDILFQVAAGITGVYILYLAFLFFHSGGVGKVVDVI